MSAPERLPIKMIAHILGDEITLEELDPYGKTYPTDDTDLEDREIVYQCEYKLVWQVYDKSIRQWLDLPNEEEARQYVEAECQTRKIYRRLY